MAEQKFEVICKDCIIHNISNYKGSALFILNHTCLTTTKCKEYFMWNNIPETCQLDVKDHGLWHCVTILPDAGRLRTRIQWSSKEVSTNV